MSLREEKKRKTKEAILEAAIALFNEHGYDNTSIAQIALAAGVGKGTVYSYFETKKEIITGFCDYELDQIRRQLASRQDPDASVLEQMVIICMTEFRQLTANPEFGRLFMRASVFPDDSDREMGLAIDEKYFRLLFPIFARGQDRGELRKDIELLHITGHFYGMFILTISAWYTGRIATNQVEEALRMLFSQHLEGLQPRA